MKRIRLLAGLVLIIFMAGCAGLPSQPAGDPSNPIKRLAVLPIINDTTDVEGPTKVREKLVEAIQKRHYHVIPVEETDRMLRDQLGITLGGQLDMATVAKLREVLQVEGLLYGTLMDYGETTTGLVNVRKVRGKFKIIDTQTESVFWENGIGVKSLDTSEGTLGSLTGAVTKIGDKDEEVPWVTIDTSSSDKGVFDGLAAGLTKKLASKAIGVHLKKETEEMIWRIVQNLPWGPGDYAGAAVPVAKVQIDMPEFKMPPPPAMGHMDYGDRDFSARMVMTTVDKTQQRTITFEMPIAKAGEKFRMDIDYSRMTGAGNMPPALSNMIMIHNNDQKRTYSLYPNKKKYMISEETDTGYYDEPDVRKKKVGDEVIDGHPTEKYKIEVLYENQDVQEGFIWNATDLDGMTIKSEIENSSAKMTSILRNIVLKTPPADLFEVPADYTKTDNFMELIMENQ